MRLRRFALLGVVAAICFLGTTDRPASHAWADSNSRPQHDGLVCLFGTLHAHSELSKDISHDAFAPLEVYEYARAQGLDFIGVSDHHKAPRFVNGVNTENLSIPPAVFQNDLVEVAKQFNQDHSGEFVAIAGIEWGGIRIGNHINIFGIEELPPASIGGRDYHDIVTWARGHAAFVQCNHPHSWKAKSNRDKDVGNFGEALYATPEAFLGNADPIFKTFSIICTVAGGHISGKYRHSEARTYRRVHSRHYSEYLRFLDLGFHLSPGASQDTHGKNPGTVTAARTAVWAKSFTHEDLMAAIRANRIGATEDDELAVAFQVKVGDDTHWMGETVSLGAEEADVDVLVTIQQGPNPESGAIVDEGPYTVEVWSDSDGVGGRGAAVWSTTTGVNTGVTTTIRLPVVAGEYIFLRVFEENGRDNGVGDGVDEEDNATGNHGADGKRDDMSDSAWTTPIWFTAESTAAKFAWSKRSSVYHDHDCWAVKRIGQGNLRTGDTAPEGKRKHACPK